MKFGVVVFPGSNCDHDMFYVFNEVLGQETIELWHKDTDLKGLTTDDCIIIPGGFSYGDYLRSGAIAKLSPIMKAVSEHAKNGGLVFGICNGFQILCEAGLLPGVLLQNADQKFICKNVYLKTVTNKSVLTEKLNTSQAIKIPIAHADGRFYIDSKGLDDLVQNDQIIFQYADAANTVSNQANPNGSISNIAGICNKGRNVFGMMPHPERASEDVHGNLDGLLMLKSLIAG